MSRPEHTGAADKFYGKGEASRYDDSARMATTQRTLADRALQLLDLPAGVPALLLDAGCGTGYSGRPLEKAGHSWIGTDISLNMLKAANKDVRRSGRSAVVGGDLGLGFAFRNGVFDGCISISAVQWLCHATKPEHDPARRVKKFFVALKAVLASDARAVLQVYPEQPEDMQMLCDEAKAAGFGGGLVVDYPWSERSKKLFLVLIAPTRLGQAAASRTAPLPPRNSEAELAMKSHKAAGLKAEAAKMKRPRETEEEEGGEEGAKIAKKQRSDFGGGKGKGYAEGEGGKGKGGKGKGKGKGGKGSKGKDHGGSSRGDGGNKSGRSGQKRVSDDV